MLAGAEVKSIREGHANLQDAYARVEDGEVWLYGDARPAVLVLPWRSRPGPPAQAARCTTRRSGELARGTEEKGLTLIPMRVYFKDGRAKVELALARGKRAYDKRQALAKRDAERETERALKGVRE